MKTEKFKKIWDKAYWLFLAAAICWPLLFVGKGIDVTDSAYYLTSYKSFFENLSTMSIGMFIRIMSAH
ncbi:MAG: hypothetical protein IKI29_04290 [Clostridia bacterium]|nr:hypothetical protein [Clostridia bacterium]